MKRYKLMIAALITAPIVVLFALSDSVIGASIQTNQTKDEAAPIVFSAPVLQAGYGEERACPLDAQSGRIIVEFVASLQDAVLTTRSESRISLGPLPVDIPAGIYDITLVSFDDHIEHPKEEAQKQESWFLQAHKSLGRQPLRADIQFSSNPISDLPEGENFLVELVQEGARITRDVTEVSARHILDVGASELAESVTPVCAAFDRVDSDHGQNSF